MRYYYDKFDKCDKHDKNDRFDKCDKDDNNKRLDGLKEGSVIEVFQAGLSLGTGTFLRIDGNFLIWVEDTGTLNTTSLVGIHIERQH